MTLEQKAEQYIKGYRDIGLDKKIILGAYFKKFKSSPELIKSKIDNN